MASSSNSGAEALAGRVIRFILAAGLASLVAGATRAADNPTTSPDVALVLVTDVSRSIDDSEFQLEKQGYAAAFADPRVIAAIEGGPAGRISVAYVEFSGPDQVRTLVDWTTISDEASARAFTATLLGVPRSSYGRTAISSGIDAAVKMLNDGDFGDARKVIDVAGDGTNNAGRAVTEARDAAIEFGITINGLTIINDHPVSYTFAHVQPPGGLTNWYRDNVTGGPGSFVVEVHDFSTFGAAMARKLLSEIASLPTHPG
jgi:hypothetical protein